MNVERNTSKGQGHITDWILDLRGLGDMICSEDGAEKMQITSDILKECTKKRNTILQKKTWQNEITPDTKDSETIDQ